MIAKYNLLFDSCSFLHQISSSSPHRNLVLGCLSERETLVLIRMIPETKRHTEIQTQIHTSVLKG